MHSDCFFSYNQYLTVHRASYIYSTDLGRSHLYRFSIQPLTILGVTGPFSVLAENIYSLCTNSFNVSTNSFDLTKVLNPWM